MGQDSRGFAEIMEGNRAVRLPDLPLRSEQQLVVNGSNRDAAGKGTIPLDNRTIDTVITTWTPYGIPGALRETRRVLRADDRSLFVEHGLAPTPAFPRWRQPVLPLPNGLGAAVTRNSGQVAAGLTFCLSGATIPARSQMSTHHIAIPVPEAEDGWSVLFHDLPKCTTRGESVQEAIWMATEAAVGHIASMRDHGDQVPAPRDLTAVGADEAWRLRTRSTGRGLSSA